MNEFHTKHSGDMRLCSWNSVLAYSAFIVAFFFPASFAVSGKDWLRYKQVE